MEFISQFTNKVDEAYEAIRFLDKSFKNGQMMNIQYFDQIINILEEVVFDYELALSQLYSNHIAH